MKLLLLLLASLPHLAAADAARDARWREDLNTIATQLPARHPNLFFQTPSAVFDQAVSDLRDAIPQLSDSEVMVGLGRIVALPRDGHTNLNLTQAAAAFHVLPVIMRWFEDGLFITAAGTDYPTAVGTRVVRIGDRSVEEAYAAVSAIISHENDSWVRESSPNYFRLPEVLQAMRIAPDIASVRFELEDMAGKRFTLEVVPHAYGVSVNGVFAPDPDTGFTPFWRVNTNLNYWFTYTESSGTLYFGYNSCAERTDLPFAQFNAQLWDVFDSKPVQRIIIDMRNNSGGSTSVLNPFILAGQARASRVASARPVIVIGRHTYSAAITNAIQMRIGPVTIVGEPSGGSPNTYTEVQSFALPNSQLTVAYSTRYYSSPGYPTGPLMPDVSVKFYSADYIARHDPFLAAVLADSRLRPDPPASAVAVVNAASFRPGEPVAPGSLATAFGDFAPGATAEVTFDGTLARLIAVAPGQINVQIPDGLLPGMMPVKVRRDGTEIASGTVPITSTAPGLFVVDPLNLARPGAIIPAANGSILQIFGTGQGTIAETPRVYMGKEQAAVLYSGPHPAFPGLWQINAKVPDGLTGEMPIFVVIGSSASNAVTTKVGN